jgi:hypothetical protein
MNKLNKDFLIKYVETYSTNLSKLVTELFTNNLFGLFGLNLNLSLKTDTYFFETFWANYMITNSVEYNIQYFNKILNLFFKYSQYQVCTIDYLTKDSFEYYQFSVSLTNSYTNKPNYLTKYKGLINLLVKSMLTKSIKHIEFNSDLTDDETFLDIVPDNEELLEITFFKQNNILFDMQIKEILNFLNNISNILYDYNDVSKDEIYLTIYAK